MTAALGNFQNGAFNTLDAFVYPQFLVWNRTPGVNDIQNPGTRVLDTSQTPNVIYQTIGAGNWSIATGTGIFTALTVTGTTLINASGAGVTTIGTGGTGAVNIGNATGNTAFTGSTTTSGNITTTAGNVVISGAAKQLQVEGGAVTDFIGTATILAGGTITIANTNIAANDRIFIQRVSANSSTVLGELSYTISAATSFTVTSLILGTPASPQTADVSTFTYFIVRNL